MDLQPSQQAGSPETASPKRRAAKTATGENKVSCTPCRSAKCKCVESQVPGATRCQRCTRLDIACLYQAHRRGRRRKEDTEQSSRDSSHPLAYDPSSHSLPSGRSPLHPPKRQRTLENPSTGGHSNSPSTTLSSLHTHTPISNLRHHPDPSFEAHDAPRTPHSSSSSLGADDGGAEERPQLNQPPANSVYHDVANRFVFSIAGVMDHDGAELDEVDNPATKPGDDPVGLGLLSMDEADSLFGHYFDQLQTCVCLLDPAIHTARYARRTSLQLFAAVITVSAKFFRPELYEPVLAVADRLVNQAIAECVCSIEIVQAICILHYWKKPKDPRGWLRLGHAIRLGYQLDLHLPRRAKLSTDETEARLVIDRERTWISLYCFDSTMTQLSDRPSMIHKAPDVTAWIRGIPYALPSDGQLDFAVKTSILSAEVRQLQSCKGSFEVLRSGLRRVLEDLHRSHTALTADNAPVKLTSTSLSINKFSTNAVQLLGDCTLLSFAPRKHRISLLHACVATSLNLLDIVVEGFARKGIMPMIEDAHSVAVASTVVRLVRFMAYLDTSAKASVMRKLTKVVIVCREAARGDQESHPAYLARFIHALLDKARQSRNPSRAPTPTHHMAGASPVTTVQGPGSGPSPLQQKTTPDQWWEEIGQFAYQEPMEPGHQDFWDGFPLLAGAMSGLSPLASGRLSTAAGAGAGAASGANAGAVGDATNTVVDMGSAPFSGLAWDADWDAAFLGLTQAPQFNIL